MGAASTLIVVFAKAPQPGKVKTRLAQTIGSVEAARLHARLLERTLATALKARCGEVELHGSPAGHSALHALAKRNGVSLKTQSEGDIGERMHKAFRCGLRHHAHMVLVGSDCPALKAADVRHAARLLRGRDAVFAPAEDGGYPLIGLSRLSPRLFEGIEWSSASVMARTRERLAALGWRWRELRTLWDIDRPADLDRLRTSRVLERRP